MIQNFLQSISSLTFFSTVTFGIMAMVIVGSSWCLIGFIMGDAPKKGIEPSLVQFIGYLFSLTFSIIVMFATNSIPVCNWKIIVFTCSFIGLGGFLNFYMLQIMSKAMQIGPNGIIWSIIQSALVFPFIVGILFFNVQFTVLRFLGIICLLASLVLFAFTKSNQSSNNKWRYLAFACLCIAAVQQNLTSMPSYFPEAKAVNSITRALASSSGACIAAIIYNLVRMDNSLLVKLKSNIKNKTLWKYVISLQFFNLFFAYTLFYPGMNVMADAGLGGMSYPMMVGSCIVSFSLTAVIILKEKFSVIQFWATIICIIGLVGICTPAKSKNSIVKVDNKITVKSSILVDSKK